MKVLRNFAIKTNHSVNLQLVATYADETLDGVLAWAIEAAHPCELGKSSVGAPIVVIVIFEGIVAWYASNISVQRFTEHM